MPSSLIVRCLEIDKITVPPNSDNLLLLDLAGWQVLAHRDTNPKVGDLRIFIPPDAVLPDCLIEELDVARYLRSGTDGKKNRVWQARLRGTLSFGIAAENRWGFKRDQEVSAELGITKYEPPEKALFGDQERDHCLFPVYSSIENYRNFPDTIEPGSIVWIWEKVEGTNSRVGLVDTTDYPDHKPSEGEPDPNPVKFMIGTHRTRRKIRVDKDVSLYQDPLELDGVKEALKSIQHAHQAKVVVLFGEIFGGGAPNGAKSMQYGRKQRDWVLIDIYVDGRFLGPQEMLSEAANYRLPAAPLLYQGPFSVDIMKECANQKTKLMPEGSAHLSEGVVIRPATESTYDGGRRLILKYKSEAYEYLRAKGKAE
jgi:RNA ligase (TIGR02306 family)